MFKHLKNILLLGTIMLLLAACSTPTAQATMQPTAAATQTDEATSTPIATTATDMTATATEKAANTNTPAGTSTAMPKITFTPSIPGAYNKEGFAIPSDSSIIITAIKETGSGQAQISWKASGTFAKGFRIYYSNYIKLPTFGGEKSEYAIPDGATRSAYVTGTPGTTYYYRLCSYTGSGCDFYSNLYTYTFLAATSTP
jgi:hypothetical protein